MEQLLQLFILIPFAGFFITLLLPRKKEKIISFTVLSTISVHLLGLVAFIVCWAINQFPILGVKHLTLFQTDNIEIFIDFYFDKITVVYSLVGSVIALMVAVFSRSYMHREAGYKRFFSTLLFFFTGYNIVIFSGNFETFFVGWEMVGVTSFLLIAFYRDRYLPVKNALKVISIYRLGDICLILAMWMSHHLWHENITFLKLNDLALVTEHLAEHYWFGVFIAVMIVIGAAAKSAQLPFSSWLPRAMEGPTTSSAIFYGSLSVHLGLFLLLRTYPYWETIVPVKALIIFIGLSTSIVATLIGRVQSTVKTQIAYSSAAQIGLMFIEVALGLHTLALIHFAGNAFLRTYQLLVSPSVLSYLVHDMFFNFKPSASGGNSSFKNSIYILSVKEWNLDFLLHQLLWKPFKWFGNRFDFLTAKVPTVLLALIFVAGLYAYFFQQTIPQTIFEWLPEVFSFIAFILILKVFTERGDALRAWFEVVSSQLFMALSIAMLNENFEHNHILMYLSGSVVAAIVGYFCLKKVKAIDGNIQLNQFHGYNYEQPTVGFIFLVACLGLVGLPFTPTFIGIDLLFSHIHRHEVVLIVLTALSFLFIEIAMLRMYARIFLGQHKKQYHAIAFKSS